ncbi:hypothetical protein [Stigmatella erecta]|uniref:Uncharacterized protein n=1 Tax=Stigmatella erecta TaxID=83460 RepID=A0A1I0KY54_9BACT|nr:hypothetical protein [Stigmatella erecta]SEU30670.1 hypothetical protein SAMN05443639_115129 [Stigmatella erecta]
MPRSRKQWWLTVAEQREWLTFGLAHAEMPFEVVVAALQDLERQFAREARTPAERLHLKRLTALTAVHEAFSHMRPWQDFGPWLRKIRRLGFPTLWDRFHVSTLYVQALPSFREQAAAAFAMLADTERRVRRLPQHRPSRQQMLDGIAHALREAARYGIEPLQER